MKQERIHNGGEFLKEILDQQAIPIKTKLLDSNTKGIEGFVKVNNHLTAIVFKDEITPKDLVAISSSFALQNTTTHYMVVANYITPKAKIVLKEKNINYLDVAENILLTLPDLIIHLEGNKQTSLNPIYRKRAFSKTGGMVVFQFLMNPQLVNAPQRQIAEYAGVSLGTIPKVLEGLRNDKFLIKLNDKEWKLIDLEKLLDKWTEVLIDKILPANYIQQYKAVSSTAGELLKTNQISGETQWGDEAAAALLTNYLIPEKYSLFTSQKQELMTKYKLIPFRDGDIAVYKKFWVNSDYQQSMVHPILVYAQLMASGNGRNMETAKIIFDEHIRPII